MKIRIYTIQEWRKNHPNDLNDMDRQKLYKHLIKTHGKEAQIDQAIEEMAELTKALLHDRRKKTETTYENVLEEFTDVVILIEQLKSIYNINDNNFNSVRDAKIKRQAEREGFVL